MVITVVALDIYGTVLASDDYDNVAMPRKGLEKFFAHCKENKALIVGASDDAQARQSIMQVIKNRPWDDLSWLGNGIWDYYCLQENPKDFETIIYNEKIQPGNLLVIGDNKQKDIDGAIEVGAKFIHVPEYRLDAREDSFDFESINLGKF